MKKFIKYSALAALSSLFVACGGGTSSSTTQPAQQSVFIPESAQIRTPVSSGTQFGTQLLKRQILPSDQSASMLSSSSCIQLYQYPSGQNYIESISSYSGWSTATVTVGLTNSCSIGESFTAVINYSGVSMNGTTPPSTGYGLTQSGPLYLTASGADNGNGNFEVTASTPSCPTTSGCGWTFLQPESTQFITANIGYSGAINSLTVGDISLNIVSPTESSVPGTLSLTLDASQAESGCTAGNCNFQVNLISPANVVLATESINPSVNSSIVFNNSNLLPGQYSLVVVPGSVSSSSGTISYNYLPSATVSVGSGTTSSATVSFAYTPNANTVSVSLNNLTLPAGFTNNVILGRILNSNGAIVQNLQFSESALTASVSSSSLITESSYTLQIQGLGNSATGVYYAPIIESFTITSESTSLTPTYASQMAAGSLYSVTANVESPISGQTVAFGSDNDYYSYVTVPLVSGSYTFPTNDTVHASASVVSGYTTTVSPSPLVISSSLANQTVTVTNTQSASHMVVGYIDGTAPGAFATIPCSAFANYDMLIIGFSSCNASNVSCAADADSSLLSMFQTVSSCAKSGAILSLSVGGENGSSSFNTAANMSTLAQSLINDINWLNSQITTSTKITGIDLDIEVSGSGVNITPLAQALHNAGITVSIAPMASANYTGAPNPSNPAIVNASQPNNFVLTGGGVTNDYAPAVAAGYVNYINLQAYNSGPGSIEINGTHQGMPSFHQYAAQTLDSLVSGNCGTLNNTTSYYANGYQVCIPTGTKILIGTVANSIAGGTYTMWESEVKTSAGNLAILQSFNSSVQAATQYSSYGGVMVWSLGNDYDPTAWSDTWDPVGAFTNNIPNFGF